MYPAVLILTLRHRLGPFPPHSYEENKETEMLVHVIVRWWLLSGLISKLSELFDAPQAKAEP